MAVKIAGALYLAWLGIGIMLRKVSPDALPKIKDKDLRRAFLESVLVEVLNPKSAIFYIAFLPQFVDPAAALPIWAQFLLLGCIVNVMFSLADIVTIFLTDAVVTRMRQSGRVQKALQYFGGTILVGLGIHLAVSKN